MEYPTQPYLIPIGNYRDPRGVMGILEAPQIPFKALRTFWIGQVPKDTLRGDHAHRTSEQLLICLSGVINIQMEVITGQKYHFQLSPDQNQGLYLPPLCWGRYTFREQTMALCMASDYFDESDYIRDYREFEKLKHAHRR